MEKRNHDAETERRTSEEWQIIYPYPKVLDPDGWDRSNFEASWLELITLSEYERRVSESTCEFRRSFFPRP